MLGRGSFSQFWKGLHGAVSSYFITGGPWEQRLFYEFLLFSRVLKLSYSWRLPLDPSIPKVPQLSSYLMLKPASRTSRLSPYLAF